MCGDHLEKQTDETALPDGLVAKKYASGIWI
jgi:hypothetical protein